MISLIVWIVFGLIVGTVSKWFYPLEGDNQGMLTTVAVGVVGSFVGGMASYLLAHGSDQYQPAGFALSILGGVGCCAAWHWYSKQK